MEEHQARCNEIQVLKFGQLIDLEMVDKVRSLTNKLRYYQIQYDIALHNKYTVPGSIMFSISPISSLEYRLCT